MDLKIWSKYILSSKYTLYIQRHKFVKSQWSNNGKWMNSIEIEIYICAHGKQQKTGVNKPLLQKTLTNISKTLVKIITRNKIIIL